MQINDRYEFPLQLDLDRDNGKYLSPDADRSVRNLYTLHRYELSSHSSLLQVLLEHIRYCIVCNIAMLGIRMICFDD